MNKKIISSVFAFIFAVSTAFSAGIKFSANVGLGFMNHSMFTKYKENTELHKALEKELRKSLGAGNLKLSEGSTKDSYNAFMTGIDLRIGTSMFFAEVGGYAALNLGLPTKIVTTTPSPIDAFLGNKGSNKLGNSIILDTQAGIYLTLLPDLPVNIHLGAGIAVNWVRTQRDIPSSIYSKLGIAQIQKLNEIRSVVMLGGGLNAGISYYFVKNVGINLTVHNSVMIVNSHNHRYYKGELESGTGFEYTISKDKNVKNTISKAVANNFGVKIGVAFKI